MKQHFSIVVVIFLIASSLACSFSEGDNVSDIGISVCGYKNNEKVVTCESAKADVTSKSEIKFNVGNQNTPKEITYASVKFRITVEGSGEAKISFKDANGKVMSTSATKDRPGEMSSDVQLTRESIRTAPEATRTGMDMESVFFIVTIEVVGGDKAEGVQVKTEVLGVR